MWRSVIKGWRQISNAGGRYSTEFLTCRRLIGGTKRMHIWFAPGPSSSLPCRPIVLNAWTVVVGLVVAFVKQFCTCSGLSLSYIAALGWCQNHTEVFACSSSLALAKFLWRLGGWQDPPVVFTILDRSILGALWRMSRGIIKAIGMYDAILLSLLCRLSCIVSCYALLTASNAHNCQSVPLFAHLTTCAACSVPRDTPGLERGTFDTPW